ncbi:hypothetical protein BD560DRAFT_82352 [Blakeslea trispora]|nr:hypothetical protein BD560DRAFT_82352 [Blakeslea trispora]
MLGHNDTRHDTLHSLFTALYHEIQEHKRQKEAATAALLAEQSHFQLVDTDTEETADYIPLACTDEEEEEQGINCISDDEQKSIIFIDSDDEVEVIEPTQPVVKKRRTIKVT